MFLAASGYWAKLSAEEEKQMFSSQMVEGSSLDSHWAAEAAGFRGRDLVEGAGQMSPPETDTYTLYTIACDETCAHG